MNFCQAMMRCRSRRSRDGSPPDAVGSSQYTCCFCCHVRMGTMFLGVFSLIKDLLAMTIIAALTLYPSLVQPQSSIFSSYLGWNDSQNETSLTTEGNATKTSWVINYVWDCDDKVIGLFMTIGSSLLAIGLLYGTVTARPRYILPYFWLQMFDFIISTMTIIGYFSYRPDIKKWIAAQRSFPFKEELMSMPCEWLLLMTALIAIVILWIKLYCIRIVWSCYQYLISRGAPSSPMIPPLGAQPPSSDNEETGHILTDTQMILPPKYEEVVPIVICTGAGGAQASPLPPSYDELSFAIKDSPRGERGINN